MIIAVSTCHLAINMKLSKSFCLSMTYRVQVGEYGPYSTYQTVCVCVSVSEGVVRAIKLGILKCSTDLYF